MASVRKRAWVTSKGVEKTAWVVDYTHRGKQHIKTFPTKREATAWRADMQHEVKQGTHTPASKSITVAEAGALWLSQAENDGLEASTVMQYRQHLNYHITPFLGDVKLAELTPASVVGFRAQLRKEGRSPVMAKKVTTSLGAILASAIAGGRVARNVVREQAREHGTRQRRLEKRHDKRLEVGVDIPTKNEIRAILAAAQGRLRPLIVTAIFTGLRASELRALSWRDVDLKRGELHVRRRADRYNAFGAPKSAAGERTIPIPPILLNTLKQHRLASKHDRLRQRSRQRREHRQHRQSRLPPRAGRGRRRAGAGQSQVHRPAQPAPLLCELVHQPARRWRTRITAEGGADAHGAFIDHHDRRCVRSFVSSQRRRQRACCG